jgi:hypothetical protein
MIVAVLALIVALGGTGYAAIALPANSVGTEQVKNGSLLKKDFKAGQLPKGAKGAKGLKGATGAPGPAGAAGVTGAAGPAGPFLDTLPSGKSLKGAFSVGGTAAAASDYAGGSISFGIPLATTPTAHFIGVGAAAPAECPGNAASPAAAPGHLCIYEGQKVNISVSSYQDPVTLSTGGTVRPWGAEVIARATAAGYFTSSGSWAVTA